MAAEPYVEPWRKLAYRAIGLVGDAIKDTNWGQPTFGDDYEDELLAEASAIEARRAADSEAGAVHESATRKGDAQ